METPIRHDGIIEAIDSGHVQVRIVQTSACAGCKVASHCSTAEAREKIIDVSVTANEARQWQVGQQVVVTTESSMAGKALMLGFGLPLMLMLAVLVIALAVGCDEGLTALLMLGSLVPYYLAIWLLRDRIGRTIAFRLEQ
ncbi:MAG: SoxR reducing system RseC family protein [Prevotella sp.]|nr:SoxR reducing system RseC family protein [Prevotella sp.]